MGGSSLPSSRSAQDKPKRNQDEKMAKTPRTKIASLTLGLATIAVAAAALWLTPRAHAGPSLAPGQSNAPGKSTHGGGGGKPGGGSSGGGSTNVFYLTVTNITQLIGDINYANQI